MCITKNELNEKIEEIRTLKALKEETEIELKRAESYVIEYLLENGIDTEITNNGKVTYKQQTRTTLDRDKLSEIFGDDLIPFEKTTVFNVLRVK